MEILSNSNPPDFRIGEWWVRPGRNELEKGDEDAVHVEPRSMCVLVSLARHAPEPVSKNRLLKEVWADSPFVGEEVISHAIWDLRRAFGDSARDPEFIETITRKGYRLLQEAVWSQGSSEPMEGVRIGRYEIGPKLGWGSMGTVFRARDLQLDRDVAIKFLAPELTPDPKAVRRFEREARLAANLEHANLATVHEIGETAHGDRFLVTPLYAGGSLKERLAEGPIPLEQAIEWTRQLAAGLAAAHKRGIIHRDIKPANLLLDEHGTLKIADFGIAKLQGGTDLTTTGATLGTPAYKSPEQSQGHPADQRSDIWSAGVVLFEFLTGRRPFDGEFEQAVIHAILQREPTPTTNALGEPIPAEVRRVVQTAMAKDPAKRFQTASEFASALGELFNSSSRPRVQPRWLWAAGLVLVAVVLVTTSIGQRDLGNGAVWVLNAVGIERIDPAAQEFVDQGNSRWLRGNSLPILREARYQFEKAVELEAEWPEALGHLAIHLAELHGLYPKEVDREELEHLLRRLQRLDDEHPLGLLARSRLALIDKDYLAAEKLSRRAIDLQRHCSAKEVCDFAFVWLAEALWKKRQTQEAERVLEECLRLREKCIRCRNKYGQLLRSRGDDALAILQYEEVLLLDPWQTTANNDLGNIYWSHGRVAKAGGHYKRLADMGDPIGTYNYGLVLYAQRRWNDSRNQLQKAARLMEEAEAVERLSTIYVAIGDTFLEEQRPDAGLHWFQRALTTFEVLEEKGPLGSKAAGAKAVCLAKAGQVEAAEEQFRALLAETEWTPDLRMFWARIKALAGDKKALLEAARNAVRDKVEPYRLEDDAAFRNYRDDPEYKAATVPP